MFSLNQKMTDPMINVTLLHVESQKQRDNKNDIQYFQMNPPPQKKKKDCMID